MLQINITISRIVLNGEKHHFLTPILKNREMYNSETFDLHVTT